MLTYRQRCPIADLPIHMIGHVKLFGLKQEQLTEKMSDEVTKLESRFYEKILHLALYIEKYNESDKPNYKKIKDYLKSA